MDRPDWRKYDNEFDRINRRVEIKDGAYRYMHRDECCCVGCCGSKLAQEIKEFYTKYPATGLLSPRR